ncbi:sensor histidine kinase [Microvirga rosea]|uniref:sensor histidine kinase n=1 Tax=Microvirga rosea TaxID=2715425 RepID=UPI001D09B85A|nr:sensor histidine kinase [Microvirga rosea]MCB8819495.1 sensor histidine kinase [Microvirga rosea]
MKADPTDAEAMTDDPPAPRGVLARLRGVAHRLRQRTSSSLTRRIVVLNLGGLFALLIGFLYLNQFRQGLIEARVLSLLTQGEIIAGAIASSATVETDTITIDPDKLLQMQAGQTERFNEESYSPLEFSINPERVAPLLRRLVTPTRTRARIFDREGALLLDSRNFYSRGDILRQELPPVAEEDTSFIERSWNMVRGLFVRKKRIPFEEPGPSNGKSLPEVQQAFGGQRSSEVRINARGDTIVSVAVPIQRFRAVQGVLLLSTQGGDIDGIIASERFALLQVFLVAVLVMIVLSLLLANAIAGPVRRLAEAAERVRWGTKSRQEIPDFTKRSDEIGHLSGALRDMTRALYNRIDAIESFAADVAHELKNPLTSLRSAVETLPLARSEDSQKRLLSIIQHDVKRLDRLISDISDASRLDAELARADAEPIDMGKLLNAVVSVANERRREGDPLVLLKAEAQGRHPFLILGHDNRLGQVFNNLIDNARSFSPPDGTVRIFLRRRKTDVEIVVEDDGPGIEPHAFDRIFERFYTDRPEQGFGQNSGLGLSISRQIIEAHRGIIRAENRLGPPDETGEPRRLGARFVIRLPAAGPQG